MEQIDLLWNYQKLDMQMDEYKLEKKSSPLRQKLVKLMGYLKEQQEQLLILNDEAEKKTHAYNKIRHEFENMKGSLKNDEEWLLSDVAKDFKQLDEVENKLIKSKEKLKNKQQELEKLIEDMQSLGKRLDDIRVRINNGKREYAKVKQQYDAEVERIEEICKKIKQKIEELEQKVDRKLLNKYKNLKSSRVTALAVIEQDRCGGCNMSLASLVIQRVKERSTIIECENCGRILYVNPEDGNKYNLTM